MRVIAEDLEGLAFDRLGLLEVMNHELYPGILHGLLRDRRHILYKNATLRNLLAESHALMTKAVSYIDKQ